MPHKPQTVDEYLQDGCGRCPLGGTPECKVRSWRNELEMARGVLAQTELQEEVKWGAPCYTLGGKNILTLSALKERVVLSFFAGAQLNDPAGLLEKPGENSRFARYIRLESPSFIAEKRETILSYVSAAIELHRSGKKRVATDSKLPAFPPELLEAFQEEPQLEKAFRALTPGRQRGYLLFFGGAKQSQTKRNRIQKALPKVMQGKGWNER
ncbi:MAG: hypothetical protein F6K07_32830 [Okeania sp. SIO1H5]|uniref:YdeI/OmpD-associated family protein n=1 Tax=Okeania sp. SIO1H5 TaxID=2607777 RepID=UPI0013BA6455|nr:hypothetical protein [Okeania sp. SIO1H5]